MATIIEKQRISKRRRINSSGPSNKSAGFNTGFMNQFNQRPAHTKSKSPILLFARKSTQKVKSRAAWDKKPRKSRSSGTSKSSGFSFPVPSLATLAVIAGTVVIAMAALNWEDIDIKVPDIYSFKPAEDSEAEQRTIQYAATGRSSIFATVNMDSDVLAGDAEINTANDNPHGSLVTFDWQQYRVQKGDSVSTIAKKFDVSVGAIIASNNISNARRLQEGAVLKIPNIDGIPYQIQRGDSLSRISASFNVPLDIILDINDIKSDNIKAGETIFIPGARMNDIDLKLSLGELFTYPLQRRFITSYYGMRRDPMTGSMQFHAGIDLRANTGTTVMAALDGVISVIGENWLYGKYIIMSHSNGYKTLYGHLNAYSVKQGDRVARGRKIGEVGSTGYSTGPHLHFGIYDKNNRLVNPLDLLN